MLKHTLVTALAFTLTLPLMACSSGPQAGADSQSAEPILTRFEYARVLMGSKARIVLYQEHEHEAAAKARLAFEEIQHFNDVLSDYDPNSEAMRLVDMPANEWHTVSEDLADVLLKSARIWVISGGAFDPTVGPLTQLWRGSSESGELTPRHIMREARSRVGMNKIEIDQEESAVRLATDGMRLDFGGIGKGYAAGKALEVLVGLGAPIALVDLGGDLAIGDPPPDTNGWDVTIDNGVDAPVQHTLQRCGVATSGDLFRFLEIDGTRYSHIVDPRTGLGLTERVAVTVIADEPWVADALASTYSVSGTERAHQLKSAFPEARVFMKKAE